MSNSIQAYIVEDDLITRAQIKTYLGSVGYQIIGESSNASKALEEIKQRKPDFVMVDINLAGKENGLWLGKELNKLSEIPFIFLTAHKDKETIEQAIGLNPDGYLIKPFDSMDLYSAIELAIKNYADNVSQNEENEDADDIILKDSVFIKDKHLLVKLKLSDLRFVKSEGNYLELYSKDKKHVIRRKLTEFERHLSPDMFIRTHQRYIVNFLKIETIGINHVMVEGEEVPVSKSYKDSMLAKIDRL